MLARLPVFIAITPRYCLSSLVFPAVVPLAFVHPGASAHQTWACLVEVRIGFRARGGAKAWATLPRGCEQYQFLKFLNLA